VIRDRVTVVSFNKKRKFTFLCSKLVIETSPLYTCSLLLLPPLFACTDSRTGPLNMFP
jgi:hypothetical protein